MLVAQFPVNGVKQYLKILQLAAIGSESEVQAIIEQMMASGKTLSFAEVEEQIKRQSQARNMSIISGVKVIAPDLAAYDALLQTANHGGMVMINQTISQASANLNVSV